MNKIDRVVSTGFKLNLEKLEAELKAALEAKQLNVRSTRRISAEEGEGVPELLDAICESIGCRWSVVAATPATPAKLVVVPLAAKDFKQVPAEPLAGHH